MTRIDRLLAFYGGTRVVITGHTGFKGAWLALALAEFGAEVTGLALAPDPGGIYELGAIDRRVRSYEVDIRDGDEVGTILREAAPEVVFHLAAQSLVPLSFRDPVETFDVNVVGTASVLAACDTCPTARSVVVATSDKVYENLDEHRPFVEGDRLGAGDPYSTSKAAAELVVESWRHSFRRHGAVHPRLVTARAGNVIGGGDRAPDRVVPDVIDALVKGHPAELRNPGSVRPWQHVLEPVLGYLEYAALAAAEDDGSREVPLALNFGPDPTCATKVSDLVEAVIRGWGGGAWIPTSERPGPEADVLLLDSSAATSSLGWHPALDMEAIIRLTVDWYRCAADQQLCEDLSLQQLHEYLAIADTTLDKRAPG